MRPPKAAPSPQAAASHPLLSMLATSACLCWPALALATENGGTAPALGYQSTLSGIIPPPGFYYRDDLVFGSSGNTNDASGHEAKLSTPLGAVPTSFSAQQLVNLSNFIYVPSWTFFGARYEASLIVPQYITTQSELSSVPIGFDANTRHAGLGDINVTPAVLGWDIPDWDLHIAAFPATIFIPTGAYSRNDLAGNTLSRHYLTIQPSAAVTYLNQGGQEVSAQLFYDFNFKNPATDYKSGQEFHVDYALAQHLSQQLAVGIGGFYYTQTTGDTINGTEVNSSPASTIPVGTGTGNFGQTFAIGPLVNYNLTERLLLEFNYDHEVYADNRPQADVLYGRLVFSF